MKLLKKTSALTLVLAMLLSLVVPVNAAVVDVEDKAQAVVTLDAPELNKKGTEYTVPVRLALKPGYSLWGFALNLVYDETALIFNEVRTSKGFIEDGEIKTYPTLCGVSDDGNTLSFLAQSESAAVYDTELESEPIGNLMFELVFSKTADFVKDEYEVTFELFEGEAGNFAGVYTEYDEQGEALIAKQDDGSTTTKTPLDVYFKSTTIDLTNVEGGIDLTTTIAEAETDTYTYTYDRKVSEGTPLTVAATKADEANGELYYQWYIEKGETDEAISGATEASYTPAVTAAGETVYYCKVTNTYKTHKYEVDSKPFTVTVEQAALYNGTLSAFTFNYDGQEKSVTASIPYLTENVDYTIDPQSVLSATIPGDYNVIFNAVENGNYTGSKTHAWTINPAEITVTGGEAMTIYNNGQTFNMNVKGETVDNSEVTYGYAVTEGEEYVSVNGNGVLTPSAVGEAEVTVTMRADNHVEATVVVSVTVSAKKDAKVEFVAADSAPAEPVYKEGGYKLSEFVSGVEVNGTATTENVKYYLDDVLVNDLATETITDAKTYTLKAVYEDSENKGEVSKTITIAPQTIDAPALEWDYSEAFVYDGSEKTVAVTTQIPDNTKLEYTGTQKATDADEYTVTATLVVTDDNYALSEPVSNNLTWKIEKAPVDVPTAEDKTFNTAEQTGFEVPTNAQYQIASDSLNNGKATNAGTYQVKVELLDSDNYKWADAEFNGIVEWTIAKAEVSVPTGLTWNYTEAYTYEPETTRTVELTDLDTAVFKVEYANNSYANAGNYTAEATLTLKDSDNYEFAEGSNPVITLNWVINKAAVTEPAAETTVPYNRETQVGVKVNAEDPYQVKDGQTSATDAGDYQVTLELKDTNNYAWAEGSDGVVTWSIAKAAGYNNTAPQPAKLRYNDTTEKSIDPTAVEHNLGTLGAITGITVTGDSDVLADTPTVKDGQVYFNLKADLNTTHVDKTFTVEFKFDSKNYETITVKRAFVLVDKNDVSTKITFADGSSVYDGTKKTHEAATMPAGYTGTFTYEYSGDMINAGEYTVTVTYSDNENFGTKTAKYTINPAELSIETVTVAEKTYDGTTGATITGVTFNGLKGSDQLVLGTDYTATGVFNSEDVATANKVTATVALKDTTAAKNYQLTTATKVVDANIKPQTVAVQVAGIDAVVYNGSAHTPAVDVTADATLVKDTDYTVAYANNTNAGTATVTVSPVSGSNYTFAVVNEDFTIEKADVAVPAAAAGLKYNNAKQTGVPAGEQYTISGNTGTNAGSYTAKATLTDSTNYKWSDGTVGAEKTINWSIAKASGYNTSRSETLRYNDTAEIVIDPSQVVLGGIAPVGTVTKIYDLTVKDDIGVLAEGYPKQVDNKVYLKLKDGLTQDDVDKKVSVSFKIECNNFADSTIGRTFNLVDKNDVSDKITFVAGEGVYTGKKQTYATATMTDSSLTAEIEYTYTGDMTNAGTYSVTATYDDAENFGTKTVDYVIGKAPLTITGATVADKTYDGTATVDASAVTNVTFSGLVNGESLAADDYTVSNAVINSANVKDADRATFTVTLNNTAKANNYALTSTTGTAAGKIVPKQVTAAVQEIQAVTYTGSALTPAITVKAGDVTLVKDTDYTVAYANNINAGSGKVTVSDVAEGNYAFADAEETFVINKAAFTDTLSGYGKYVYTDAGSKEIVITGIPDDAGQVTYGEAVITDAHNIIGSASAANGKVTVVLAGQETYQEGLTATIKIPVTMGNYQTADLTVTVDLHRQYTPVVSANDVTMTYTGAAPKDSVIRGTATHGGAAVSGTWSWVDAPKNAGVHTVNVLFTPTDIEMYAPVNATVKLTINKAATTGEPAIKKGNLRGQTLADAELSVGTITPANGTIAWDLPADTRIRPGTDYTWTFVPADPNYTVLTGAMELVKYSTGGSSTPSTPSTPSQPSTPDPVEPPAEPGDNVVVQPVVDEKRGTAQAIVSNKVGEQILEAAVESETGNVVIAPEMSDDVNKTEITLPAKTVGALGEETSASLTIETPVAAVTIPNSGLNALGDSSGSVTVSAEKVGNAVTLTVTSGRETVTELAGGITLTVPAEETTVNTVAVLVREDGTRQVIRKSVADGDQVTIPLSGTATVEIVENVKTFNDMHQAPWAADSVAFASSHELLNGTGNGNFSPNSTMTRGMLAQVLHNMENNMSSSGLFNFTDTNGHWAAPAVSWAAENGLVGGYGNGNFGVDNNLTREQMVVILYRYANLVGADTSAAANLHGFADVSSVSVYAQEAMSWAVAEGIIGGSDGKLLAGNSATRAQVATILARFLLNIAE